MEVFEVLKLVERDLGMEGPGNRESSALNGGAGTSTTDSGAENPAKTSFYDPKITNGPSLTDYDNESSTTSNLEATPSINWSLLTESESTQSPTSSTSSPLSTSTTLATDEADNSSGGGGGTSTKTKLAIAIPVAIVGAIIIMAIVFFILRRRRRRQNATAPSYEVAKNEDTLFSTSQLMAANQPPRPDQNAGSGAMPRFPMLDVPDSRDGEISPGSSGQMSQNESAHTELGFGMAVTRDHRPDTTEQDLRHISRSASPANAVGSQIPEHRARDDDDVSVVSDYQGRSRQEHDYDDMSSVSSFDGDTPRADDHQHPFR